MKLIEKIREAAKRPWRAISGGCPDCKGPRSIHQEPPHLYHVINTHNEGEDVLQTILSMRAAYDGPYTAVVVADATTDGSCEQLDRRIRNIEHCPRCGSPDFDSCIVSPLKGEPCKLRYGCSCGWTFDWTDGQDKIIVLDNAEREGCGKCKALGLAENDITDDGVVLNTDGHHRKLLGDLNMMARLAAAERAIFVPGVAPLRCWPHEQPIFDCGLENADYGIDDETAEQIVAVRRKIIETGIYPNGSNVTDRAMRDLVRDMERPPRVHSIKHIGWGGVMVRGPHGMTIEPGDRPKTHVEARSATWWATFMASAKTWREALGGWNEFPGRWGSQEIGLALRAWFADVPIMVMRDVVIGHRHRNWAGNKNHAPYGMRVSERRANHRYAHEVVFDPETVKRYWRPLWDEVCPSKGARKLLAESRLEAQGTWFREKCKVRTDAEFFEAFGTIAPQRDSQPRAAVPHESGKIPVEDITAILLAYRRPVGLQRCVDQLVKLGLRHIWVWANDGAKVPAGATRVFSDSENGVTWPRYAIAPMAETPWVLFIDDDCTLRLQGLDALRAGAVRHPGGNLGLIGSTFTPPFNAYRRRTFKKSHQVTEDTPVDMIWPKGQLISRDLVQKIYGHAETWQLMRAKTGRTRGDDLVATVAQQMIGAGYSWVVPSDGRGYKEPAKNEGRQYALAEQKGEIARKRQCVPIYRDMGWTPVGMSAEPFHHEVHEEREERRGPVNGNGVETCAVRLARAKEWDAVAWQHPDELGALYGRVERFPSPKVFVEIGSKSGGSFYALAGACDPDATIVCIDPSPETKYRRRLKETVRRLRDEGFDVHRIRGKSCEDATLAELARILRGRKIDFLFVDGDHRYEAVADDWATFEPMLAEGALAAFHDAANTKTGVPKFWEEVTRRRGDAEMVCRGTQCSDGTTKPHPTGIGIIFTTKDTKSAGLLKTATEDIILCTATAADRADEVFQLVKSFRKFHPNNRIIVDAIDWPEDCRMRIAECGLRIEVNDIRTSGGLPELFAGGLPKLERIASETSGTEKHRDLDALQLLCAHWRLHMLPRVMKEYGAPVLWMDTDCIVRGSLTPMMSDALKHDLAITTRPKKEQPRLKVLSSVYFVNATPAGAAYLERFAGLYSDVREAEGWWTDQTIAWLAIQEENMDVMHLSEKTWNDSSFRSNARIWHAKTMNKTDPRWIRECGLSIAEL